MSGVSKVSPRRTVTLSTMRKCQLVAVAIGFTVTISALLIGLYPHQKPRHGDDGFMPYPQDVPAMLVSYPAMLTLSSFGIDPPALLSVPILAWFFIVATNCLIMFFLGTGIGWLEQPSSKGSQL